MARGGQRELILEQRHLLGVFFAVVLLAAVAFAGGFILGRQRGEQEAAAKYASVAAAMKQPGEEANEDAAKPDASDLTFFDSVGRDNPIAPAPAKPAPARIAPPPAKPAPAPAASEPIFLQVGAFSEEAQARKLVDRLAQLGFTARAVPPGPEKDKLYRVRVGPFHTAELADAAERRLKAHGYKPLRR